jgi:hypothetical protein
VLTFFFGVPDLAQRQIDSTARAQLIPFGDYLWRPEQGLDANGGDRFSCAYWTL